MAQVNFGDYAWWTSGWRWAWPKPVWFGGDEYGRKTIVIGTVFGALVIPYRYFRWNEVLDWCDGNEEAAQRYVFAFALARQSSGWAPQWDDNPDFSAMTLDQIFDWEDERWDEYNRGNRG